METSPSRTLVIDGDVLIYKACEAHEYTAQFDDWMWRRWGWIEDGWHQFEDIIKWLQGKLNGDNVLVALSDGNNWRKKLLETYKFSRKSTPKPCLYHELRRRVQEYYNTFVTPGLEADDVCGILMTHPDTLLSREWVTVSIDKDFNGIPGAYYNVDKDVEVWNTVEDADRFHMRQALVGDATDGFPGCPTIGPVRADKLLGGAPPEAWWDIVVAAYEKQGLDEQRALIIARIARTLRWNEYNFDTGEIALWTPENTQIPLPFPAV
jgi:DNA polymerase-1